jgi:hypothetical protein
MVAVVWVVGRGRGLKVELEWECLRGTRSVRNEASRRGTEKAHRWLEE